jgi:hypothetical protein|uniref:Uncharacterized protein n=1 Tax=Siphoviridae sp. ctgaY24 TaxID=2827911 RepID=A0A8S5SB06_9CAUD|nr:MAG TPA: hypothetical protein [Siphoviridae sp. ctgaY24]
MSRNRKTTSLQELFSEDYTYEAQDKPLDDNEEYLRFRSKYWTMLAETDDTYKEDYM